MDVAGQVERGRRHVGGLFMGCARRTCYILVRPQAPMSNLGPRKRGPWPCTRNELHIQVIKQDGTSIFFYLF